MARSETLIDGPYFEDLHHGQRFDDGAGLTLTEGMAAAHRAIVGGRMPLTLDRELFREVVGEEGVLAAPNLVWDVAIGQSTSVTHTVAAFRVAGGDVVSSARELARLTLNVARVHHDETAGATGRLVYGGHTIGLALRQAVRALPGIVTVVGWHSCGHVGPVREGDTLTSAIEVDRTVPARAGGILAHLRSRVRANRPDAAADVLDWRFVVLLA
jgi:acyl dehydratase